jgi:general secretion pathway protein K
MTAAPKRQRGIALVVALLTVALAVVLIAGLLDRGELSLARTRNALRASQAEAYAQGLEAYAAEVLVKSQERGDDSNASLWAAPMPPETVPGGLLNASMRDLNGCFNLNNLSLPSPDGGTWLAIFNRLLGVVGVDASLTPAIQAWMSVGDDADVTDGVYLAQPVPYRSAQRVFTHVSELRLVRGVDSGVYARLAPYVCALPAGTPINVNTASVPVLQSLGIPQTKAESLWQNGVAQWSNDFATQWTNQYDVSLPQAVSNQRITGVDSNYFLARADVRLDDIVFTFYSVLERSLGTGVRVVGRSRGSDDALVAPVAIASPDPGLH